MGAKRQRPGSAATAVQWHTPEPLTSHEPARHCLGPYLPNDSRCTGSSLAQRACERQDVCAGLYFDTAGKCRMLICADNDGHRRGRRRGGRTQRFASRVVDPRQRLALLHNVSHAGCSPNGFMMRHLFSQHALSSFSGTPARYFTILETGGRTWLVWKEGVHHGDLSYAPLEGPDTAGPTLLYLDRQTFIARDQAGLRKGGTLRYSLTHNTALLIHQGKLLAIGGHIMDGKVHRGVHHVSMDADALAAAARDEYLPWSPPRLLFTGRDQGCIEGRVNANGISSLTRHGLCVYDGRLSLVFFRGRFLLYARANPTIGRRFVQVTSSVDLREWTPLRSIRLKSIIACDANIYTFTVQSHPLRNDRLVAFFPAVLGCQGSATPEGPHLFSHSGLRCKSRQRLFSDSASGALDDLSHLANASLMISCSADGHLWSQPFPLFLCRTIGQDYRAASLPIANGLRLVDGNRLFVWVHQDVPYDKNLRGANRSKVVRYELDGAAFRHWSAQACRSGLMLSKSSATGSATEEEVRPRPYNSSRFMRSLAKRFYEQRGQTKELRERGTGWCGGRVPLAPWARRTPHAGYIDDTNDDFFFNETWTAGLPKPLFGRVNVTAGMHLTGVVEMLKARVSCRGKFWCLLLRRREADKRG